METHWKLKENKKKNQKSIQLERSRRINPKGVQVERFPRLLKKILHVVIKTLASTF